MDARIRVDLTRDEYSAIIKLAMQELRPLNDEVRYLIRCELERRGLIKPQPEEVANESTG